MRSATSIACLILVGIWMPRSAFALTGDQLLQRCTAKAGSADYSQCESYIAGVADGTNTLMTSMRLLHPEGPEYPKLFCTATGTPTTSLVEAVTGYLSRNAGSRHFDAASEVLLALREAFPCVGG